jgi:hypothetical protein
LTGNVYATRVGSPNVEVFAPISGHEFLETFGSAEQPSFANPTGMAVDPASGDLLVIDLEDKTLHRFQPNGEPAPFSALGSNVIDGHAGGEDETPQGEIFSTELGNPVEAQVAVAPPGAPGGTEGDIYVTNAFNGVISVFDSSGKFVGEESFSFPCGVAVDPVGDLYVGDYSTGIHKLTPTAHATFTESAASPYPETTEGCQLAAGEGSVYFNQYLGKVTKVHSRGPEEGETQYPVTEESTSTVGVEPGTNRVFTVSALESEIREFNTFGASSATESAAPIELDSLGQGVAIDGLTGNVYATRVGSPNVEVFAPGEGTTPSFPLSIQKAGNGSGTVTSLAPNTGIECGTECDAEFEEGTGVELEASADADSEFTGWSAVSGDPGTCTGTTSPCTVTIAEAVELEAEFTLLPPSLTGLDPSEGPAAGGNAVEITGAELIDAEEVKFGAEVVACPSAACSVESNTRIIVTAPGGAAGTVDVRVITPGGESADTASDDYTYVEAPSVSALSPSEGPSAGGNPVQITGTNLAEASKVEFGATVVDDSEFDENTATTIELNAPTHFAGTFDVLVTTVGGPSLDTAADDYTFIDVPAITALSPAKGPPAGGNPVVISGLRLAGASKVEFGAAVVDDSEFAESTDTTIKLNAPAHEAGTVKVRVTTVGGKSLNFHNTYTYEVPVPAPNPTPDGTPPPAAAQVPPPPPPAANCVVPRLKGLGLGKAKAALAKADCELGEVRRPKRRKGKSPGPLVVRSSKPGVGATLSADAEVDLRLGRKHGGRP